MLNVKPLCVDLDGTLIFDDMVPKSMYLLLKKNIFYIFLFPFWMFKGFAYVKRQVAKRIEFSPASLSYNQTLLDFINQQRQLKRKILLVTASDQLIADKIANFLGIFDEVIGSDAVVSYSGVRKLKKLQEKFGVEGFDYAGNAYVDLKVWAGSHEIIIVSDDACLIKKAKKLNKKMTIF